MVLKDDWLPAELFSASDANDVARAINEGVATRVITVSGVSGDTTALTAAITAMTTAGKVNGSAETTPTSYARITSPVVINLGYSGTYSSSTWDTETHEKVRLRLDILPDANLGAALTIKGGIGADVDINVLGGGNRATVTDVSTTNNSITVTSAAAVAGGLKAGAVVEISGAGYSPEGTTEKLFASVRSVNTGANTFTLSEKAYATLTAATMTWMDVAVRVEDHNGLKLNVYGKAYDGCLVAADANDSATKRVRSMLGPGRITGIGVGKTLFWKAIEALGTMPAIFTTNATPDYIGLCGDLQLPHYTGAIFKEAITPDNYLIFDRCNEMSDVSIAFGDRAPDAFVKIIGGGDVGRFNQIYITGYRPEGTATISSGSSSITNWVSVLPPLEGAALSGPGIPLNSFVHNPTGDFTSGGAVTIVNSAGTSVNATASGTTQPVFAHAALVGVKLVGVDSIEIGTLETKFCAKGLRVIGGGGDGIRVKRHVSLTSEFNPVVIEPGATGTAPRIDIRADYRAMRESAVRVLSGMTGGSLRLSGYIENPNLQNYTSTYTINCASALFALDVADLTQPFRGGNLSGSINHADPALIHNVSRARLGDNTVHGVSAPSTLSLTPASATQNTTGKPIQVSVLIRHQPADAATSVGQISLGRTSAAAATGNFGYDVVARAAGAVATNTTAFLIFTVPAWWWFRIDLGGGSSIDSAYSIPLN